MAFEYRLRRAEDIRLAATRGRRLGMALFRVSVRPNSLGHARFSCIISRKVDKRAVVRNRIRRRVREYLRHSPIFLALPIDVILTAEKSAATATKMSLYEVLDEMVTRLSTGKNPSSIY
ncbi:MAG: ribonuclease P protein component [bacterium]|nr:ribonuclease P protein component [bacterium]MDZ4299581.1 ribonuclease P protein component [Candidatus Sungbacteria bacterium]